jgi:hypothetical protein
LSHHREATNHALDTLFHDAASIHVRCGVRVQRLGVVVFGPHQCTWQRFSFEFYEPQIIGRILLDPMEMMLAESCILHSCKVNHQHYTSEGAMF